jgi:predicted metalloprotease
MRKAIRGFVGALGTAVLLAVVLVASASPGGSGGGSPSGTTSRPVGEGLSTEQLRTITDQAGQVTVPISTPVPHYTGSRDPQTMYDFIDAVMQDVNEFWSQAFEQGGVPYSPPSFVVVDQGDPDQWTYDCGPASAGSGPFYCPTGGQFGDQGSKDTPIVYYGAPWLYREMSKVQPDNFDFAVASVVAHEFGHHVQWLLSAGSISLDDLPGKFRELSADCLGGVWANAAYHEGQLEDTDIEEAMEAAWQAGSDLPDETGPDPHGTRQERVTAFKFGYDNGDTMACLS